MAFALPSFAGMVTGAPEKLLPCSVGAVSPIASSFLVDTKSGSDGPDTVTVPVSCSAVVSCLSPPPLELMTTAITAATTIAPIRIGQTGSRLGAGWFIR